jgi:hypothetical protein
VLVVPFKHDKLKVIGQDGQFAVSSYTSFKSTPAVYIKEPLADGTTVVFFKDILELNGVPVKYDETTHLLEALGPLKRPCQLPQPGDKVSYMLVKTERDEDQVTAEVADLRLHARNNPSKSLQVKLVDNPTILELTDILDIERKVGGEKFNRAKFQRCYIDYLKAQ